jgi:hypothetical protein
MPPWALLVQVRYGRHANFDRIVFQFENGLPDYRIEYAEPPNLGDVPGPGGPLPIPVPTAGSAFLKVSFGGAAAHDPDPPYDSTYLGPQDLTVGLPSLVEAEMASDWHGDVTWVLGLSDEVDFRVFSLEEPSRIVIDVAHP